jgi:hypothetical protein
MQNPFSYLKNKFGKSSSSSSPLTLTALPDAEDSDFARLDNKVNALIDSSVHGADMVGWFFLDQLKTNISKTFFKEYLLYLIRTGRLVAGDGSVLVGSTLFPSTGDVAAQLKAVCGSLATQDYKYVRMRKS